MLKETLQARWHSLTTNEVRTLKSMCNACSTDSIPEYVKGLTCMLIYCPIKIELDNKRVKLLK
jgi:hypothetical protein